jgi:tRNA (mo5U34)-methyltransferase
VENISRIQIAEAEQLLAALLAVIEAYNSTDRQIPLIFDNLVKVYLISGQNEKALEAAVRCYRFVIDHNTSPLALALAGNNLAVVHRHCRDMRAATETFAQAIQYAKDANDSAAQRAEAVVRLNRGVLEAEQSHWAEAENDFLASLRIQEQEADSVHGIIGDVTNNLGVIAYRQGHYEQADAFFKRALAAWELDFGSMSQQTALCRCNMAAVKRAQGSFTEAEWWLQRALRIFDRQDERRNSVSDPFFANILESPRPGWRPWLGPEVGLLRAVTLYEDPLTIDVPNTVEQLPEFSSHIDQLRSDSAIDDLRGTIDKHGPWYHNLTIRTGLTTNPEIGDHPVSRWRLIEPYVPADLSGKTVLDIGCNAGYFSLEMKRRGATRVLGVDVMPKVLAQARFMSTWERLPIELREIDTYDVESLGLFDYVIFVGVLYHLKHPLYALEKVAQVCKDTLFFQSVVRGPATDFNPRDNYPDSEEAIFDAPEYPKLYFVEKSYNGDVSNWWFATPSCLKAMLRTVGFREIIPTASPDTFICRK